MEAGDEIRRARREQRLSQAELAARIGSTQPQVSAWERGNRSPKVSDLQRIAEALDRHLVVTFDRAAQHRSGAGFDRVLGKGSLRGRKARDT